MERSRRRTGRLLILITAAVASIAVWPMVASAAEQSDPTAPAVLQASPVRGEEIAINGAIELTFSKAMNQASVEDAFTLTPSIAGSFRWISEDTVQFAPVAGWERDREYRLRVGSTAEAVDGSRLLDPFEMRFRSVGLLEVTQTIPSDGSTEIETDSAILIIFNRPVVPLTAISTPAGSNLPMPVTFSPRISGSGEWLNPSTYVFQPESPLAGGTTYSATVAAGLADISGGLLVEDATFAFTTQRPGVVSTSPVRNEELVAVDTEIRITFNMPIDLASAAERVALQTSGLLGGLFSTTIDGALSVEGNTLIFTPNEPLEFDRSYRVTLEAGITGAEGGLGTEDVTAWRFQTVPLPKILGTSPDDGELASSYSSFLIHFNAPIDPDTVMPNIRIEPEPDPSEIRTYFRSWDLTYVISFGAQPSHDYTVFIEPGIADPYGNTTDESMTVRFRTSALGPSAWLHVPGRVGTLSTYDPSRLFVGHRNTGSLRLTLTRLTVDEYFEALEDWYRFSPPRSEQVRSWTQEASAPLNKTAYAPVDLMPNGAPLEAGIYVVDLEADGVDWNRWQHRHILVVSPINLTLKTTDDETLVWATDLSTGRPVPGLILWALDGDGEQVDVTVSDSQGVALLDGAGTTDWRGLTVVGRSPFVMASQDWDDGMSRWEFGFGGAGDQAWRAFVDTDRPIYRTGQTVSFRGVLRAEEDASYTLPPHETVDVTIWDSIWNIVHEETLTLDRFGTYSGQVSLPEGSPLGTYRIETSIETRTFSTTFEVAAYRAPEFSVTVTPDRDAVALGEPIDAVIQTAYFFGAPVSGLEIEWRVIGEDFRFSAPQFGRFAFTDVDDPWGCWSCWWWTPTSTLEPILEGAGSTDEAGNLLVRLPADIGLQSSDPESASTGSRILTLEATATGRDGQTISGRTRVIVHQADHYVGLATSQAIGRATEPMSIDAVTVDWSGERVGDRAISYTVYRREWINEFVENDAGGGEWTWTTNDVLVTTGETRTDAVGEATIVFTPPEGGSYKIVADSLDRAERRTRSSLFVWVTGPDTVSWRRTNDDRITLISDKTTYRVGETAEILIPSPYPGAQWALITVERAGILSREVIELPTNSTVYPVRITEAHIPNIYVSVVLVQGREAALALAAGGPATAGTKVGYVALSVATETRGLNIEMTPSTDLAQPGDRLSVDLRTTDASGDPVAASIAFDAVDQAVLSLRPRTPNAILDAFYAPRGLGVGTASGLSISIGRLVLEQLRDAELADDGFFGGDEDRATAGAVPLSAVMEESVARDAVPNGAGQKLPEGIEIREDFADTAAWIPSVVTDSEGRASIAFDLPDNLTTWELRAVGVTQATQVGEETSPLLVSKPLLIRPVTPRFFVVGDRVLLAALVSNQTENDLVVEVTAGQTGLLLHAPATQVLTIPAMTEREAVWPVTVEDVRAVELAFSAVSGDLSDAARPRLTTGPEGTLPVYRYTAPETVGTAGVLSGPGTRTEGILLPETADPERSELTVRLDPSLAAAMQDGLSYLEHFEYECTEQVVSRFLPNALTARALAQLGVEDETLASQLEHLVPEGVEKLYQRQNSDGGWGWWSGDESSPYLTAYAVFGLLRVQEIGFPVRDSVITRALDHLERSLVASRNLTTSWEANRQAWLLYVLALGGRGGELWDEAGALFDIRGRLSHYAKAYLAMAIASEHREDPRLDTLLSDLVNAAILSATGAHWEEPDYDWWAMNTDTRSTAIILDALVMIDPENPLAPNIVRWLMTARREGIWETTQETAWALVALTDWMVATGELSGDFDYSVLLDGAQIAEGTVTPQTVRDSMIQTIDGTDLTPDQLNRLTISRTPGDGSLYYTAHLSVHLPVEDVEPLGRGIFVYREYLAPSDEEDIDGELSQAYVGDTVRVRITIVAPHDLYYVVVEDPIPAGCEAIDTSLETASLLDLSPSVSRETDDGWGWLYRWWWQWYTRTEIRDEKVVLFADYLAAGTYTYEYGLRAVQPGEYRVLPASASEFYFPEVFGRSDGRLFTVIDPE